MKKQFIAIAVIGIIAGMTGCGNADSSSSSSASSAPAASSAVTETTAARTTESTTAAAETSAPKTTETVKTTEPETTTSAEAEIPEKGPAPTIQEAREIIDALEFADKLAIGVALEQDDEKVYTDDNGTVYHKVTDANFTSVDDVKAFMYDHFTDDQISEVYFYFFSGESPKFIDTEDGFYTEYRPIGGIYSFTDREPRIEDTFADGYSIFAESNDYGGIIEIEIAVIRQDDKWKICMNR